MSKVHSTFIIDTGHIFHIFSTLSYQEVIVEPGYTVLSIVEHLHTGPISASIQEVIFDFQELNPGVSAEKIQIGQTYLFPL